MSNMNTPGPWTKQGHNIHNLLFDEPLDARNIVATIPNDNPESHANARLIAEAPELLKALQNTLQYLVTPNGFPDKGKGRTDKQQYTFDAARAAIKKATQGRVI